MIHILSGTPPLIAWVGQFFVPLRHLTGDFKSAILCKRVFGVGYAAACLSYHTQARCRYSDQPCGCCGLWQLSALHRPNPPLSDRDNSVFRDREHDVRCSGRRKTISRTNACNDTWWSWLHFPLQGFERSVRIAFLTYITVALFAARDLPNGPIRTSDLIIIGAAVTLVGATLGWYFVNWENTVQHFINSTTAEVALNWGSAVQLGPKLRYWTLTLSSALSPFHVVSICIGGAISLSMAIATIQLRRIPFRGWPNLRWKADYYSLLPWLARFV